ncbi:hypothetical protein Pav037_2598 [Pseudomonas syringae pv. avellanae str. ISPaVe037]|nr:hypothetical protein Pav037_2598 [Pseudomonas syringae pv. avellanae str. ISPaVe037]
MFSCSKSEQKQLNTWVSFQSAEQPLLGQFSVSDNKRDSGWAKLLNQAYPVRYRSAWLSRPLTGLAARGCVDSEEPQQPIPWNMKPTSSSPGLAGPCQHQHNQDLRSA